MYECLAISAGVAARLIDIDTTLVTDGATAWVDSVRDIFVLDKTSVLVADGITIITPTVGPGRWIRKNLGDAVWRKQAAWNIDALLGNDENVGSTALTALKTHGELERRWGIGGRILQSTTVTILSNLPSTDALRVVVFLEQGVVLTYLSTPTTVRAGVFTGVTVRNRATNQPYEVADVGVLNWLVDVDQHLRITGGPNIGATMWVMKDLGASVARITEPALTNIFFVIPVVPVIGDPYVIETFKELFITEIKISSDVSNLAAFPFALFQNLKVKAGGGFGFTVVVGDSGVPIFHDILWEAFTVQQGFGAGGFIPYTNNYWLPVISGLAVAGGQALVDAGGNRSGVSAIIGGQIHLDSDHLVSGFGAITSQQGGMLSVGAAGFFDVVASGFSNPFGSGIYLRKSTFDQGFANLGVRVIWGAGNAGYGMHSTEGVDAGVNVSIGPFVTGALGDFSINGTTTSRAFDNALGSLTTLRANTWVNFKAAIAGPVGMSGNAHRPEFNASIIAI